MEISALKYIKQDECIESAGNGCQESSLQGNDVGVET